VKLRLRWFYLMFCVTTTLVSSAVAQKQAEQAAQEPETHARPLGTEFGYSIYEQTCTSCHGNPASETHAPDPAALRQMTPEAIYDALTTGSMAAIIGPKLTDEQKRRVAGL
jgi:cytochrome c5